MATLADYVADLPRSGTLFAAEPWTPESDTVLVEDMVERVPGHSYLMECDVAAEVLEVWSAWRDGRTPTLSEATAAVIHYATFDAYQPA